MCRGDSFSTDEGPGAPEGQLGLPSKRQNQDSTRAAKCRVGKVPAAPASRPGEGCGAHRPLKLRPQRPMLLRTRTALSEQSIQPLALLHSGSRPSLCSVCLCLSVYGAHLPHNRAPLSSWRHGSEIVRGRWLCKREMDGLTQVQGQSWKSRGRGARPGLKA